MEYKDIKPFVSINGNHILVTFDSATIEIKPNSDYVSHLWYLDDCMMALLKAKDVTRDLLKEEMRSCDEEEM